MYIRFMLIRLGFGVVFALIIVRLFAIMVVQHDEYTVMAHRQHFSERQLTADRGEIYSSDNYPLVINAPTYLLFADGKFVEDPEPTAKKLSDIMLPLILSEDVYVSSDQSDEENTELPPILFPTSAHTIKRNLRSVVDWKEDELADQLTDDLNKMLSDKNNRYIQLFHSLSSEQKELIEASEIQGLYFKLELRRTYPEGSLAAHVLGFVGKDTDGTDRGYFGLEGQYDGYLAGHEGYELRERDLEGKPIPFGVSTVSNPTHGRDIVLTVRRELQYIAERKLKAGVEKYKAKNGTIIIIDPHSGAVWAMASYPTFYPAYWTDELSDQSDVGSVSIFRNPAISFNYEPGSVMKPITMSMALNENIVSPNTIFNDTGPVEYSGYMVRTWNDQYHGEINMSQILQLSNNTGAAWVGTQVGADVFNQYLLAYKFGQKTGIDLQGEETGIVPAPSTWRDINLANMSFGQGISVTPIQLVTAFSALVNGGHLYKPYVVDTLIQRDPSGDESKDTRIKTEPQLVSSPIDTLTSDQLRYMLESVVTDGEFSWFVNRAGMDKYAIGGKTGTAQIPVGGRYDPNKTNVTFIGFAPVSDPQFVMLIELSEPSTSTYSAETVVPVWMDTAHELMNSLGIPPRDLN